MADEAGAMPVSGRQDLSGRVAIVTGAARGIGRAVALALARDGADIVAVDLLPSRDTVIGVSQQGRRAIDLTVDITHRGQIDAMVERALQEFGRVDILVNNAGVAHRSGLEETTEAMWRRDVDVIMTGTFLVTQAVYPVMRRQRHGKIVNVSSVSAKNGGAVSRGEDPTDGPGGRTGPAYAAAKGGVLAFTRWVAKDGGRHGIWCNAVCPARPGRR